MLQASLQVTLSENDTQFCQLNQIQKLAYKQKMFKKAISG